VCSSTAISVDECKRMTDQVRPAPTQISPELQSAWEQCEALQAELAAMSVPLASSAPVELPGAAPELSGLPVNVGNAETDAKDAPLDRNRSFEQPEGEATPTSGSADRLPSFRDGNAPGMWDVHTPTALPPIEELRSEKRSEKPDVSDQVEQQPS
jgi:hypothetical protein